MTVSMNCLRRLMPISLLLSSMVDALVTPGGSINSISRHGGNIGYRRISSELGQSKSGSAVASNKKAKKMHTPKKRPSPKDAVALSEEELNHHVATKYMKGPGGPLEDRTVRRVFPDTEEHSAFMQKLNSHPALVLNADYQPLSYLPLSVWNWQDAVKAIFSGKVTVVDVYPGISIKAASIEVPVPSVIALNDYVPLANHQRPAFTRRNVFLRDEYTCQYCNKRFHTSHLTLDHVVPRSKGGLLNWSNAVTSCQVCNGRKGSKLLKDLRSVMKLKREPVTPTQFELATRAAKMVPKKVHQTWIPYLGFVSSHYTSNGVAKRELTDSEKEREL